MAPVPSPLCVVVAVHFPSSLQPSRPAIQPFGDGQTGEGGGTSRPAGADIALRAKAPSQDSPYTPATTTPDSTTTLFLPSPLPLRDRGGRVVVIVALSVAAASFYGKRGVGGGVGRSSSPAQGRKKVRPKKREGRDRRKEREEDGGRPTVRNQREGVRARFG